MDTTKVPRSIEARIAEVRREITMCLNSQPTQLGHDIVVNIAALLIIIARQERDEALAIGEALCRMHGGTNDNAV